MKHINTLKATALYIQKNKSCSGASIFCADCPVHCSNGGVEEGKCGQVKDIYLPFIEKWLKDNAEEVKPKDERVENQCLKCVNSGWRKNSKYRGPSFLPGVATVDGNGSCSRDQHEAKVCPIFIKFQKQTEQTEQITKREYLLNLVAKTEANKKEFNKIADKAIESAYKELNCAGCSVHIDGDYVFEKNLSVEKSIVVADFIKDMETKMDEVK